MIIGQVSAGIFIALSQPSYNRKLAANGGIPIPEWRLPPVIIGGISFAGGFFGLAGQDTDRIFTGSCLLYLVCSPASACCQSSSSH